MTLGPQRVILVMALVGSLLLSGCLFNRTGWNTRGRYTAHITGIDGKQSRVSRSVSPFHDPRHRGRVRLCNENAISVSVVGHPAEIGAVLALRAELDGPLCEVGIHKVMGGHALVYATTTPGGSQTTGIRSDSWTISGTAEITRFMKVSPPPKKLNKKAIVERVVGVINLVAEHENGDRIIVEEGSFEILVEAHRFQWEP